MAGKELVEFMTPTHNKAQQFAAGGRRTPFTWLLRRHSKVAAVLRRYVYWGTV